MQNDLPLLSIGTKVSRRTAESDGSAFSELSDDLKGLILTSMKNPISICQMVQLWASLRKIKEGPDLWMMVYAGMQVPLTLYPPGRSPTKEDLEQLCKQIGDPRQLNDELKKAAQLDNLEALKWLLSLGATRHMSAVFAAASHGSIDSLKVLLKYAEGRRLSFWLSEAVDMASRHGQTECLKFVLETAPTVLLGNTTERAVTQAAAGGHVNTLLWLAAQPQYIGDWEGGAIEAARRGNLEVIQICEQNGANEWARILTEAAMFGKINAAEYAFSKNATILQEAFNRAALFGRVEMLEWLAERGQPDWQEALEEAEIFKKESAIAFIREQIQKS